MVPRIANNTTVTAEVDICGQWSYNDGRSHFKIYIKDGNFIFAQGSAEGILREGTQWWEAETYDGFHQVGTVRLKLNLDNTLSLQVKRKEEPEWGVAIICRKDVSFASSWEEFELFDSHTRLTYPRERISDQYEYGYQGERKLRRDRICCYALSLLLLFGVCWASSIAAYRYAWQFFWAPNTLGEPCYESIEDHFLYIGIMSPPENFKQRLEARSRWIEWARTAIPGKQVHIEFVIGQVPIQANNFLQDTDVVALKSEKKMERALQDEGKLYGDISRVPVVEDNSAETLKTFWLWSNAVSWHARFVLQTTDDRIINVERVTRSLEKHLADDSPIYFGMDYDPNLVGEADGHKTWHFNRSGFGISGDLACNIIKNHLLHTMAFPAYGSSNAAVNVAKWAAYEEDLRKKSHATPVMHMWLSNMSQDIHGATIPTTTTTTSTTTTTTTTTKTTTTTIITTTRTTPKPPSVDPCAPVSTVKSADPCAPVSAPAK